MMDGTALNGEKGSEMLAGYTNLPCVIRKMTDEEAILAMTESNFTYRSEILASERAQALKMQLDAIKRQGERFYDRELTRTGAIR